MKPFSDSVHRARPLLGTLVEIGAGGASDPDIDDAITAAFSVVAQIHALMSFHEPESDVSRLNREASSRAVAVHHLTYRVLCAALDYHYRSAGLFDITVAPAMQRLGLLPARPDDDQLPRLPRASRRIELLPEDRVRFSHQGTRIDLGGIAKGFAVDRAIDVLRQRGMAHGLVNAGGDLAAFGPEPVPVCIRDPRNPLAMMLRVELCNQALASTGGTLDLFQDSESSRPPVIDPRSGTTVEAILGASVKASSCLLADALTKPVMIAGEAAGTLLKQFGASAIFVSAGGVLFATSNWEASYRAA